jgi:hypothetical protein
MKIKWKRQLTEKMQRGTKAKFKVRKKRNEKRRRKG